MSIKAIDLNKSYKDKIAVSNVSITLKKGQVTGLLGPNGAGKTTTFYMIVGLLKADSGKIILGDKDITKAPIHKRARLGIGYLPQEMSLFRKMTAKDNIMAILQLRKGLTKKDKQDKLKHLLEEFNLSELANIECMRLSGGEKRRLEIARTLAIEPEFILLDEPFAGVDPISITEIKKIILQLINKNIGILITDHNVRETLSLCDQAYIINHGKIIYQGTSEEVLKNKTVRQTYLGEQFSL